MRVLTLHQGQDAVLTEQMVEEHASLAHLHRLDHRARGVVVLLDREDCRGLALEFRTDMPTDLVAVRYKV